MGQFHQNIDAAVLARARRGDPAAFAELYDGFGRAVFGLAYRLLGRRDVADEVVQDCFLRLLKQIGTYRGEAPFGLWLRQIAVRLCLGQMRSGWWRLRGEFDIETLPGADAADAEQTLALQQALGRLSGVARTVVWLHDVEGMTHAEIGSALGKSPSFSKSQLARAYGRLRDELREAEEAAACMPATHNS